MAPTLYNIFNESVTKKEKKPRTAAQIEAFAKAREALALKRKTPKDIKEPPAKKVEVEVITDEENPPPWFKKFIREVRERSVQKAPQKIPIKESPTPPPECDPVKNPEPEQISTENKEKSPKIEQQIEPSPGVQFPEKKIAQVELLRDLPGPIKPQKKSKLFPGRGF